MIDFEPKSMNSFRLILDKSKNTRPPENVITTPIFFIYMNVVPKKT